MGEGDYSAMKSSVVTVPQAEVTPLTVRDTVNITRLLSYVRLVRTLVPDPSGQKVLL